MGSKVTVADNKGRFWLPIGNECSIFMYIYPTGLGRS
jgi:hypothetical protein